MSTPPPATREPLSLPPVLRNLLIAAALFWVACLSAEFYCTHVLHLTDSPYARLILPKVNDYADARIFVLRFRHFHSPEFFSPELGAHFLYPAPDAFFYWIGLSLFGKVKALLLLELLACVTPVVWFWRALQRHGLSRGSALLVAAGVGITSYPVYFELNRGNVEVFIWLIAACGVVALLRDRPWLAAVLIGLAGACKGYPFLYLGLFLPKRKFVQAGLGVVVGVAVNLFSLWAITANYALGKAGVAAGLQEFRDDYILTYNVVGLDHSFFALYKRFVPVLPPHDALAHGLAIYLGIAAVLATVVYFGRVIRLPLVNQLIFLSVMAITLPPISFDYTLLHMYTGFALLAFVAIQAWRSRAPNPRGLGAAFVCYALLLTPQNELILHGDRLEGAIKCLALLALATIATLFPFPDPPLQTHEA